MARQVLLPAACPQAVDAPGKRRDDGDQVLDELVVHGARRMLPGDVDGRAVAREVPAQVLEPEPGEPVMQRQALTPRKQGTTREMSNFFEVYFNGLYISVDTSRHRCLVGREVNHYGKEA